MDKKIEEALKDSDIQNIMNKAAGTFRRQLSEDEIHTCKLNALWKAFCNHDENKAAKFTTYLYNGVRIECIREVKFNQKKHSQLHPNIADSRDSFFKVDLMDELESCPNKELLMDKMENLTIKEIAQKHGCNRETIRRKIKKSINHMSKRMK
tara:strand:+ start:243 stop:698 length:456 start_codon:yes stop_codon:yes gene_type:complete